MAREAMESAEATSDPEIQKSLFVVAGGWRALAVQIEESLAAGK
jgi:hypothetical protein